MNRYKYTGLVGKDKYNITLYPIVEENDSDIYIIAPKWTRLDSLAEIYYRDVTKWVIIARANNLDGDSLYIDEPIRLRIPIDPNLFISKLEDES